MSLLRLSKRIAQSGYVPCSEVYRRRVRAVWVPRFVLMMLMAAIVGVGGHASIARAQEELFVTNGLGHPSVTVYARTASGNITPIRRINGSATGLVFAKGLAVDTVNNELFVAESQDNSVTVYARTADGNIVPTRTLSGAATGLSGPAGLALDPINNELVIANTIGSSVTVYARTASGNTAPTRTISGSLTGLSAPDGVAVDPIHGEILVVNVLGGSSAGGSVTVYARTASGNTAPTRTISGSLTGLSAPRGLAVDTVNNELFVANPLGSSSGSVTVYARTASGNTAPLRTLSGSATGLSGPTGVVVDSVNNELLVANNTPTTAGSSVTVYARTASGDTAPTRTIIGSNTELSTPRFLAVTTSGAITPNPSIGRTLSSPAAVMDGSTLHLVIRGADGGLYLNSRTDGAWSGWGAVPGSGQTPSQPSAVVVGGTLRLYVQGMDNRLYLNSRTDTTWSGWSLVPGGGQTPSGPAVVLDGGQVRLVVRGIDDRVYLITP